MIFTGLKMNFFKRLFFAIIFLTIPSLTFSQSGFSAGASFNIAFPVGDFNNIAKTGIGGSLIAEYGFSEHFSATFSLSLQNFNSNLPTFAVEGSTVDLSITSIPVLLGARYYFTPDFFLLAEAGTHFFKVNADISDIYNKQKLSTDYKSKFGGGLGGGIRYRLADASVFEISGVYQYVTDDLSSIALRAAVMIFFDNI